MSIAATRTVINRFLKTDTPEVLAIKGAWGVGKTFAWKNCLLEAKKRDEIKLNRYSYVSLFGVNSLDEFRFLIFQQTIPSTKIGDEPNLQSFGDHVQSFVSSFRQEPKKSFLRFWRKSAATLAETPALRNFASAIKSISFLDINQMLICIDDFERKGDDLSVKDILGFISQLKEQRFCKIVLIFNDISFAEKSSEEYKMYREKVVDTEVEFKPLPTECADIALSSYKTMDSQLRSHLVNLGITNIRIIFKVIRLTEMVLPLLKPFHNEVAKAAIQSLVLFVWSCYSGEENVPSLTFIKKVAYGHGLFDISDRTESEKKWTALLQSYGYFNTDEFDLQLLFGVENGYFNEHELIKEAERIDKQIRAGESEQSFKQAWAVFRESFDNNEKEVCDSLEQGLIRNAKHVSPLNLNSLVELFRRLEQDERANKLIEHYVSQRQDERGFFSGDNLRFPGLHVDESVRVAFAQAHRSQQHPLELKEAIRRLSEGFGLDSEIELALSRASEQDIYDIFKTLKGEDLPKMVNACLRLGDIIGIAECYKTVADHAKGALKRIASESRINRVRAQGYGIDNT